MHRHLPFLQFCPSASRYPEDLPLPARTYPRQMAALTTTDLPALKLLSKGKVRDVYATSSPDHLLFVATDRISAYDVILRNVRPPPCYSIELEK